MQSVIVHGVAATTTAVPAAMVVALAIVVVAVVGVTVVALADPAAGTAMNS